MINFNIENYQGFAQAFEHLQEKIEILRQTQVMINKEIWKKKQIVKIMYTNKSFSKNKSRNTGNKNSSTFDAGSYSYGQGLCHTEELEPNDDLMYDKKRSKAEQNTSFTASQRGLTITESMTKKTIQEEAREIEKLRNDVEDIEDKIEIESQWFELYYSKYEEAKILFEDKKSVVDDLSNFISILEDQIKTLTQDFENQKNNSINSFTQDCYNTLYNEINENS